jgi:hypothetical protein
VKSKGVVVVYPAEVINVLAVLLFAYSGSFTVSCYNTIDQCQFRRAIKKFLAGHNGHFKKRVTSINKFDTSR